MRAERILGWSVEAGGRKSHLVGESDFVVGTSRPAIVTVRSSLCGTAGHSALLDPEPNNVMCSRCLGVAFAMAKDGTLPALGEVEVEV